MKTFSEMSKPIMFITYEAYDQLWHKLHKRHRELTVIPKHVLSDENKEEMLEIKEKIGLLNDLLIELAPMII